MPELNDRLLTMEPEGDSPSSGGDVGGDATGFAGRLRLGGPVAVPVSDAYVADAADLRTFVEREAERYR